MIVSGPPPSALGSATSARTPKAIAQYIDRTAEVIASAVRSRTFNDCSCMALTFVTGRIFALIVLQDGNRLSCSRNSAATVVPPAKLGCVTLGEEYITAEYR